MASYHLQWKFKPVACSLLIEMQNSFWQYLFLGFYYQFVQKTKTKTKTYFFPTFTLLFIYLFLVQ